MTMASESEIVHDANIQIWKNIISACLPERRETIFDFFPGKRPVVENALLQTAFSGKLFAFDASKGALEELEKQLSERKFSFKAVAKEISAGDPFLKALFIKEKPALVAFNHPIDDLISFRFCKENKIDYYQMLADFDFSRGVWDKICEKPEKMEKFVLDWFSYFAELIPAKCFLTIS